MCEACQKTMNRAQRRAAHWRRASVMNRRVGYAAYAAALADYARTVDQTAAMYRRCYAAGLHCCRTPGPDGHQLYGSPREPRPRREACNV